MKKTLVYYEEKERYFLERIKSISSLSKKEQDIEFKELVGNLICYESLMEKLFGCLRVNESLIEQLLISEPTLMMGSLVECKNDLNVMLKCLTGLYELFNEWAYQNKR